MRNIHSIHHFFFLCYVKLRHFSSIVKSKGDFSVTDKSLLFHEKACKLEDKHVISACVMECCVKRCIRVSLSSSIYLKNFFVLYNYTT